MIAISATAPDEARSAAMAARLPYPVLSDRDLLVINRYGVSHADGPEGRDIARPAIFLLDRSGIVRYAYVGEHSRDRPARGVLLLALEGME